MTRARDLHLVSTAAVLGLFLYSVAEPAFAATLHPTADVTLGPGPVTGTFTGCRSITAAGADFIPAGAALTAGALHDYEAGH